MFKPLKVSQYVSLSKKDSMESFTNSIICSFNKSENKK